MRRRSVLEATSPESVKAEIKVKMGAMSMTFTGTVEIVEQDADAHRAVMSVKSREAGGQGHRRAVEFALADGDDRTNAQITGKAASMGEGVVVGVLDALITDFTGKLGSLTRPRHSVWSVREVAIELDHRFPAKPLDESYATILDLERVVPCVEEGRCWRPRGRAPSG